jgi:hypothetical protein
MKKNSRARFLPVVMFPAILPAVLMPVMVSLHVPANLIGGAMGFSIGLAIVGVACMAKGARLPRS